jgi:hypothetical protein
LSYQAGLPRSLHVPSKFAQLVQAFVDPSQRGARCLQALQREIESLSIMGRQQKIPDLASGESVSKQISQSVEVAGRFSHLLAIYQ